MTFPTNNTGSRASVALDISGMSCEHCVSRVDKTLKSLPGVAGATVHIGGATVAFDPAVVSSDEIAASVTHAGYPARSASSAK